MRDFEEQVLVPVGSGFVERVRAVIEAERGNGRYSRGALEILDLHKPNERGTGCEICSLADDSCGCVGSAEDSYPCSTVIAVGRMFGVEYVPPPAPEPVEPDLDALRTALDPDDAFGLALLDFEQHPTLVVNGCPLSREQRIDGASFRPAWQKLMRDVWPKVVEEELFRSQLLVGAPAVLRGPLRPGEDTVEVSMSEPDFRNDKVTMKITWRP